MATDPTGDLSADQRAIERRFPLDVQRRRRRQPDADALAERVRQRKATAWRRELAAFAAADPFDDDAAIVPRLRRAEAQHRIPELAEEVRAVQRKASRDVRAAWFALGEAAQAAGSSPIAAGFSGRTVRAAALAAYWRRFLEQAAEIGLLPDDAVSPHAMMAWLAPQLPEGWRYGKALRLAIGRRRARRP